MSKAIVRVKWLCAFGLFALLPGACSVLGAERAAAGGDTAAPMSVSKPAFAPCYSCGNCHQKIYDEHMGSMHSCSFTNPVFLAQYAREVLPRARTSLIDFREARSCTRCHAPVAHYRSRARLIDPASVAGGNASVTCDFCHRISGFTGPAPINGNYQVEPGISKYGPFRSESDWHHEYNQIQTRSEFCAICHSVRNRLGLDIKSTYAEWKASRHAKEGIQCQDCHMSVNGFLTEGKAVHEAGQAAVMSVGNAPTRQVLYTHAFQGARSRSQIEGAIQLAFGKAERADRAGEGQVELLVDNSRTGHKMPSGSVELRFLWLEVYALHGGRRIDLAPLQSSGFDLTGRETETDSEILAGGVPANRRIYRTILRDSRGRPTLAFYQATTIGFDNRLGASEVRRERYRLALPEPADTDGPLELVANMYYVAYPNGFADRLGLPRSQPVKIASARTRLGLGPLRAGD